MKIVLDVALCSGHAQCNAVAPKVYDMDDQGFCMPLFSEVPAELENDARLGSSACPEGALSVTE